MKPSKIEKFIGFTCMKICGLIKPSLGTKLALACYERWGMQLNGVPNYVSTRTWFDGSDYSRIILNKGCTISSEVSFLTHDWSLHTIAKSLDIFTDRPLGKHGTITIGEYAFVGRGVILLPGCDIGAGSLIAAGSVVRGEIPPNSLVLGNPAKVVGNSADYVRKNIKEQQTTHHPII